MKRPGYCKYCKQPEPNHGMIYAALESGNIQYRELFYCNTCAETADECMWVENIHCIACKSLMGVYQSVSLTKKDWRMIPVKGVREKNGKLYFHESLYVNNAGRHDIIVLCSDACNKKQKKNLKQVVRYRCGHCDNLSPQMHKCSVCKIARYCNRECQRADWPKHKTLCSPHLK